MSNQFTTVPFSSGVHPMPSPGPGIDPDRIQILDDPGDPTPDEEGDAAFSDDSDGPAEAPTRAAFLRSRAREALRLSEAASAPVELTRWSVAIRNSLPEIERGSWLRRLGGASEARLAAPDARGDANRPEPDREAAQPPLLQAEDWEARLAARDAREKPRLATQDAGTGTEAGAGAVPKSGAPKSDGREALTAIAAAMATWPKPRSAKAQEARNVATWAAVAGERAGRDCACQCKKRFERSSKALLIAEIARLKATAIPESMLWSNHTRAGLIALLCGHLCEEAREGSGDGSSRRAGAGQKPTRPRAPGRGGAGMR